MAIAITVARKIGTLAAVGPRRQLLVVEAVGQLVRARYRLKMRGWTQVAAALGTMIPADAVPALETPISAAEIATARLARQIGWAVGAVAPFMPFRAKCLEQAMAVHAMLRARGVGAFMYFGASPSDGKISAHAWIDAAGVRVIGYPVAREFTPLGCFVPGPVSPL
ncbi:MAG: lasso peptide biosynthesis B2 protein [Sphingomonas sp.]|nr:lasso peptide biosynthesis B2 protein [Sphingomonas sp.]